MPRSWKNSLTGSYLQIGQESRELRPCSGTVVPAFERAVRHQLSRYSTREAQNLGFAIPVEDVQLALVAHGDEPTFQIVMRAGRDPVRNDNLAVMP